MNVAMFSYYGYVTIQKGEKDMPKTDKKDIVVNGLLKQMYLHVFINIPTEK
jgi:hypothetical protein